jgi:hypothetical protein
VFLYVRRCPTLPPGLGSTIGADRLSFRVRDGTGRFPAAVTAVTLFKILNLYWWGVWCSTRCGVKWICGCDLCVGKFSAG